MQAKTLRTALFAATVTALASPAAFADHNSVWGEGWANMPNDIHNTRIDTRLEDDNDAFTDFVRAGAGADSVNRFLVDGASAGGGAVAAQGAGGQGGGRR